MYIKQSCYLNKLKQQRGFPDGSEVKNLPAMQETQETRVQSLGQEKPLEEEIATHSSILAWRISWTEEAGGLQSIGSQSQTWLSIHVDFKQWNENENRWVIIYRFGMFLYPPTPAPRK